MSYCCSIVVLLKSEKKKWELEKFRTVKFLMCFRSREFSGVLGEFVLWVIFGFLMVIYFEVVILKYACLKLAM